MERPDADDFPVLDVDVCGASSEDAAAQVDSLYNGLIGSYRRGGCTGICFGLIVF